MSTRSMRVGPSKPGNRWLGAAQSVGDDVHVTGPVLLRGLGSVEIADEVTLDADGAPIELLAAPGGRLRIGPGAYLGPGVSVEAGASVSVGPGAVIGAFAKVLDNNWHDIGEDRRTEPDSQPIVIGAGARIGARAVMMPGSMLGEGSVLEDDSVLSGRVPAGVRVAGVPARRVSSADAPALASEPSCRESNSPLAFPTVGGGPGPVSTWEMRRLARVERLRRMARGPMVRALAKAELAGALVRARRRIRGAEIEGRAYAYGWVKLAGNGSVQIGNGTTFVGGPMETLIETSEHGAVRIGSGCTFNYGSYLRISDRLEIEDGALLGTRVLITDDDGERRGPVVIGRNVWLAHGVTVCPGVHIGDGSAVSAGAVVDKDIPEASLAFGSPVRFRPIPNGVR